MRLCYVEGDLVWQSRQGLGIRFRQPSAESTRIIEDYILTAKRTSGF
jgi:hypothetical protein